VANLIVNNFELIKLYKGTEDPHEHILFCKRHWVAKHIPLIQWVHRFVHTMDMVPRSWYIEEETIRKIGDWGSVSKNLYVTFNFVVEISM
jgi:hypothetical protein